MVLLPGCQCCPSCWPFPSFEGVQWEADIVCAGSHDYTMSKTFFLSAGSGGGTLTKVERFLAGGFSGTLGGAIGSSSTSGDVSATFTAGEGAHANPPYQQVIGDLLTISRRYLFSLTQTFSADNTLPASQRPSNYSFFKTRSVTIRRQCSYPGIGPSEENIFNTVTPKNGQVFLSEGVGSDGFTEYLRFRNVSLNSAGLCATTITANNRERVGIQPGWLTDSGFAHTFPIFEGYDAVGYAMLAFDLPISVTAVRLVFGGVSVDWYKDGQSSCV